MKKIALILIIASVGLVAGCRTKAPRAKYRHGSTHTSVPAVIEDVKAATVSEVGTTNTVGVGESLLTSGYFVHREFIVIPKVVEIGGASVHPGRYQKNEQTDEFRSFRGRVTVADPVTRDHDASLYIFANDPNNKLLCISKADCAPADYSIERSTTFKPASFQQTLLYNGKIGNRITLAYREFTDNMARPAFNNEVTYDLSESMTLGYKGARLQVVKATNTEITYKVLTSFSQGEWPQP
jgi:hypothetical protein